MKKSLFVAALIASTAFTITTQAVVLREVQFVGYSTGNLGASAETGSLEGWQNSTAQVTVTNGVGSLDGTALGLVASEGDRAFVSATEALNVRNFFVPANGTFPQSTETNIYYSFLYKFNNAADVDPAGEIILRLNRANSGTGTAQHWDLLARNVDGQIQIGISKAGEPSNATNYATTNISIGQTVFVVVRQHIIPGAQNDVYYLWINPPPESFGADEDNLPPASASIGELASDGTEDSSGTGPGRLVFAAGVNAEFDELRIATTWAEVTPQFGQCVSASIVSSPMDVTQSAEISATFQVVALGTSRTYQWQVSSDSGASWTDIPDGTGSTYITPSLPLSANGNQYRVIVTVDCNNSSATSAVATVSLTAPTVTPVGTVMNDTFLDPDLGFDDRANEPLTPTNSLWYTSVTENLTAFGQDGNLLGIPVAGSSSLWLGYFTEPDSPPVHLGVGRAIKVTLPFIANSYNSFTNNATLRLGLFDYYDSGNRIIADGANVGGSQGNAAGVRGYMLALNFGPTFTDTTPMEIYARNFLPDINLMGTISDYESLGSGPVSGVDTNEPAFVAGVPYTLEFIVARTAENSVTVTTTISGNGTNWSLSVTDDNYAYHRFDAFGIRPNSLETSADSFSFSDFIVEVIEAEVPLANFSITEIQRLSENAIKLTWESQPGVTYHVLTRSTLTDSESTIATITATGATTSYTNSPTVGSQTFYRILAVPAAP